MGTSNNRFDFANNVEVFRNSAGDPHCEAGPAVTFLDSGLKVWMRDGAPEREGDEPTVSSPQGLKIWMKDGKVHRDEGPAWIWEDGREEYFRDGVRLDDPHEGRRGVRDERVKIKRSVALDEFAADYEAGRFESGFLRVWRVAEILGVTKKRVYRMIEEGKLEVVRSGPKPMQVTRESFARFARGIK